MNLLLSADYNSFNNMQKHITLSYIWINLRSMESFHLVQDSIIS